MSEYSTTHNSSLTTPKDKEHYLRDKQGNLFISFYDISNDLNTRIKLQTCIIKYYGCVTLKNKNNINKLFLMTPRKINSKINVITISKLRNVMQDIKEKKLMKADIDFILDNFLNRFNKFNIPEKIEV